MPDFRAIDDHESYIYALHTPQALAFRAMRRARLVRSVCHGFLAAFLALIPFAMLAWSQSEGHTKLVTLGLSLVCMVPTLIHAHVLRHNDPFDWR